jgi:hypothetical protein
MSAELDALTAEVTATTEVEASAVTLIEGLAGQLTSLVETTTNYNDLKAGVTAQAAALTAGSDALAAAVAANTVAG